jgi:hypothetical protein
MKNKIIYGITVSVIGVMLAGAQTAMSAAAWMLPETGLQMESQAKQASFPSSTGRRKTCSCEIRGAGWLDLPYFYSRWPEDGAGAKSIWQEGPGSAEITWRRLCTGAP